MPATLSDIARDTNTSVSTVSRVLAGGPAASRISQTTRAKVIKSAQKLGYQPNLLARSLRTRRTNTVALLVSDIANPFFGQTASLIEQALHRHGYSLMLCNSGEDPEREREYLELLPRKGIDGLIMVPYARSRKTFAELIPPNLPVVVFDRLLPGAPATVASDQEQATEALCDTLERVGVKRVALISGPREVWTHRLRAEIISRRFQVMESHEGPAQRETGRQAFVKFLSIHPQAVVCTNNFLGQGFLDAINTIERPPIVAVFDELAMMHLLPLPVVSCNQDIPLLADGCVRLLLKQLNPPAAAEEPAKPETILLPARVITNPAFQKLQHV